MRLWRKAGAKRTPSGPTPAQWEIITRKPLPGEPAPWQLEADKPAVRSSTKPPEHE